MANPGPGVGLTQMIDCVVLAFSGCHVAGVTLSMHRRRRIYKHNFFETIGRAPFSSDCVDGLYLHPSNVSRSRSWLRFGIFLQVNVNGSHCVEHLQVERNLNTLYGA
uniref:Uncharacterized protein n=1 Tax=Nelumbo nucifera TaxID=4432 RepID=A0A822XJT9_NELNU|nr:TPA_asm: hypothetical protein HUJ06_023277 [Nelumbo nucifera]